MAVGGVELEDDDPASGRDQVLDDPDADRAEPDDDDVPAHRPDPALTQRMLEPAAHQELREQREQDGREHDLDDHQEDRVGPQRRRLLGEGEVAVADGADGLDGEVDRVEQVMRSPDSST